MRAIALLAISLMVSAVCCIAQQSDREMQKDGRLAWWREARFGMFIHWGPISLKGTEISWSRGGERRGIAGKGDIPVEVYDSLYTQFNPSKVQSRRMGLHRTLRRHEIHGPHSQAL